MRDPLTSPDFGRIHAEYGWWRPAYPDALFDAILASLPGSRRLALDLGSGTGLSAAPLARRFERVIAAEPDPDMFRTLAQTAGIDAVRASGEALELEPASVDLVTCANSLYWMDTEAVLPKIARWLRPAGLLAAYRSSFPDVASDVVKREFREHWNPFRHPRVVDEGYSLRILAASPHFDLRSVQSIPNPLRWSAEQLIAFLRSTSYVSAFARTLPDPGAYLAALQASLAEPLDVRFEIELILATSR